MNFFSPFKCNIILIKCRSYRLKKSIPLEHGLHTFCSTQCLPYMATKWGGSSGETAKTEARVTAGEAQGRKRRLIVTVPHCNGGVSIYINNLFSNRTLSKTQYINQNNFLHFLYSISIKTVFFFFFFGRVVIMLLIYLTGKKQFSITFYCVLFNYLFIYFIFVFFCLDINFYSEYYLAHLSCVY